MTTSLQLYFHVLQLGVGRHHQPPESILRYLRLKEVNLHLLGHLLWSPEQVKVSLCLLHYPYFYFTLTFEESSNPPRSRTRNWRPNAQHRTSTTEIQRDDAANTSGTGSIPIPLGGASRIIGNSFRNKYLSPEDSSSSSGLRTSSSSSSSGLGASWSQDVMD